MGICFETKNTNQNNTLIQDNIILSSNDSGIEPKKSNDKRIAKRKREDNETNSLGDSHRIQKMSNEEKTLNKYTIFQSDITIEIQNFSKKFTFLDIFFDYNDNIFDKIKIHEFNIKKYF
jgi:hypothetical protein